MSFGKRWLALLLVPSLALACGEDSDDESATESDASQQAGSEMAQSSGGEGAEATDAESATDVASSTDAEPGTELDSADGPTREQCRVGCEATLAAECPIGPTDQDGCEADCMSLGEGACGETYRAFQSCADGEAVTCGDIGIPVVEACQAEQDAFIACLNG